MNGDGDKPLRCHQWLPLYDEKIGYKLSRAKLTVPVDRWFGRMSGQTLYPLQDPLYCAKKIRNQMDLTKTHLLHLGNISEGSRVIFRWDLLFDMVSKKEDFMFHCSKSSVNITDRQDPSLAGEIASTYRFFLKQNFDGMGIYLKAL